MVQHLRLAGENSGSHLHTGLAEDCQPTAADLGVRIAGSHNHLRYTGVDQQTRARRRLTVMRAWLEGHIHRALRKQMAVGVTHRSHSVDLGMSLAITAMPAAAYNPAAGSHNHGPHHRVGAGHSPATRSQTQGQPHILLVDFHRYRLLFQCKCTQKTPESPSSTRLKTVKEKKLPKRDVKIL